MLREATNNVTIEGILSEIDIREGSFKDKNGNDVESINGVIKVKVEQTIDGEMTPLEIPVHVFSKKITNAGKPNPSYQSILNVKENFVSISAAGGEDGADRIKISGAKINMNEYWIDEQNLSSYPRIMASFFTKIDKDKCVPKATFEIIFVVGGKEYELNSNGEETGRYKIKGIMPKFNGTVDVVPFFVQNKSAIDALSQYWNEGDTVYAQGKLLFTSKTETITKEVDFGEPITDSRTINISNLIITGGTQTPYEGDFAYNNKEIEDALIARKNSLEEKKKKDLNRTKKAPNKEAVNSGFANLGF